MDDAIGPENVQQEIRSCQDPDRLMIGRAICASLLLHLLLFLILARTATHFTFYPAVGAFEHFDFIWVTPSPEPAAPAVTATGASPLQENSEPGEQTAGVKPPLLEMPEPMAAPPPQHPGPGKESAIVERPLEVDTVVSLEILKVSTPPAAKPETLKKGALAATKKELRDKPRPAAKSTEEEQRLRGKAAEGTDSKPMPGYAVGKNNHPEQEQDAVALRMEEEIAAQQHYPEKPAGGKNEPEVIVQQGRPVGEQEKHSESVVLVTTVPEKAAAERSAEQARLLKEQEKLARQAALDKTAREKAAAEKVAAQARLIREQEKQSRQAALEKAAQEKAARERIAEQARPLRVEEKLGVQAAPPKTLPGKAAEQARPTRKREAGKSQPSRQAAQQKEERADAGQRLVSARALEGKPKTAPAAPKKPEQGSQAALSKAPGREPSAPGPEAPGSRLLPGQKPQAPLPGSRVAKGGDLTALAVPKSEPAEALKPSERMSGNKGLVIASPRGDLKLVITGDNAINLSVTFREYPKNRRNKVTRSEARKVQTLAPILTRTREDTKEAVIETARAGVYTFSAESKQEKGSRATFTLKLFESGSGERIAKLGTRTVSGMTILVKVLMPEAIIWDDESAFSGTLEDSDSETKFNTETGLFWKEFHD